MLWSGAACLELSAMACVIKSYEMRLAQGLIAVKVTKLPLRIRVRSRRGPERLP